MKADIERSSNDDPRTPCFASAEAGQSEIASRARESYFEAAGQEFPTLPHELLENSPSSRPLESKSAEDSASALLDVIDELFDAYESEGNDWRAESIEFSLPELLNDIVKMFGERADEKGLCISIDNSAKTPWLVSGDRDCLRQLLVNLLGQAVQHDERGSISVRTAVTEETSRRALVRFTIEAAAHKKTQEPPNRDALSLAGSASLVLDGGKADEIEACRRLAERLGGTLDLEALPERGSTVSFSIVLNKPVCDRPTPMSMVHSIGRADEGGGPSSDAINVQSLLDRCFGDADFCTLMLRKFSHRAGDQMSAIDRAVRSGNALELARGAYAQGPGWQSLGRSAAIVGRSAGTSGPPLGSRRGPIARGSSARSNRPLHARDPAGSGADFAALSRSISVCPPRAFR